MAETDIKPELKTLTDISDYYERMKTYKDITHDVDTASKLYQERALFAEIILEICNGIECHREDVDFIDMLVYTEKMQLKTEEAKNFYEQLAKQFSPFAFKWNFDNMEKLNYFPHVKLKLVAVVANSLKMNIGIARFRIDFRNHKMNFTQQEIDEFDRLEELGPTECTMEQNEETENPKGWLFRLHVFLRLVNVRRLSIIHIKDTDEEIPNYFPNITLTKLRISRVGGPIGCLIRNFLPYLEKGADHLEISFVKADIPILKMIGECTVKMLTLYQVSLVSNDDELLDGMELELDFIWQPEIIQKTLDNLFVRRNSSDYAKKHEIKEHEEEVVILAGALARICKSSLKYLYMRYFERPNDDYTECYNSPLAKTLENLDIVLNSTCPGFISFIRSIELIKIECNVLADATEFNLDVLLDNIGDQNISKSLKDLTLDIHIPGTQWSNKSVQGFGMLNLSKFRLKIPNSTIFHEILPLPSLQKSIESLWLKGSLINEKDLDELAKFEKLKLVCFAYDGSVGEGMSDLLKAKNWRPFELKDITLKGVTRKKNYSIKFSPPSEIKE